MDDERNQSDLCGERLTLEAVEKFEYEDGDEVGGGSVAKLEA